MRFSKRTAVVVSGLAVAGGTALGLGTATTADAAVRSTHQGWYPNDHHRQASRLSGRSLNANRTHERTVVINRIKLANVSKNTNNARQRAASAAGGGGGGGGGGADQQQQQQQQQQTAAAPAPPVI